MKLCIIAPSFIGGGAERIAVNLANHYTEQGYDVSLLVFKGVGPYADQVSNKVRLIDLKASRNRYVFFRLWKSLKKEQPTHVLSVMRGSNIILGLLAWISKDYRLVYREASTLNAIVNLPMLRRLMFEFLMKLAYSKVNLIIANSEDTKTDLVKSKILDEEKIVVVGNPVLPADYKSKMNQPLTHPWFTDPKIKVVLTVGRLHKLKNQALLVKAFSEVVKSRDEIRLVILGSGEERDNLLQLAEILNISEKMEIIHFQENPYPYYKNADLFVLTSDWEGFGNVLVEAMACGTPVISTDCPGGPKSIISNKRIGSLIPVNNIDALEKSISDALRDFSNVELEDAINRASVFSIDSIACLYMDKIKNA